jgi:hypothetical protein
MAAVTTYKVSQDGKYVKEMNYRYLVECSEEKASLFTEKEADEILAFLGEGSEKIKVESK